ncbi:response regulator [Polynucleobacter paneuropaeus]|jgi:class 3 adenylate cyclase|nr:response regulator [Polynucleobacter paneuropaeus]MBT8537843.1 response regulator [Polynucleobacter paneuropaeus]MBT8560986.1 response regulator [Polynucleobacter paneuropaeus]
MTQDPISKLPQTDAQASLIEELQGMRVLVVDDSRTLRKFLIRELNQAGITRIDEATNGLEAVELLKLQSFDLMLLDMEMPELDGLDVLKIIKADSALSYLPIIVISGAEDFAKTVECIQIGAEDYLPKPFDPVLLKARVYSSLEKKRLRDVDRERISELQHEKELLHIEQMKTEKLMLNILPKPIADRLKKGEKNIAGNYPESTVLFSDLVGFTKMSSEKTAGELVTLLNSLFTKFDQRAEDLGLEKIKTIGDAYMAVGGLPIPRADHADIVADMALGMFIDLQEFNTVHGMDLGMRIGINSGPVVAGVIGFTKFSYDLWGNTVNTASRMESTSLNGRVQISSSTQELLKSSFNIEERELIECKGLGKIMTYFLNGRK